jgi:hypothetical protein
MVAGNEGQSRHLPSPEILEKKIKIEQTRKYNNIESILEVILL